MAQASVLQDLDVSAKLSMVVGRKEREEAWV